MTPIALHSQAVVTLKLSSKSGKAKRRGNLLVQLGKVKKKRQTNSLNN